MIRVPKGVKALYYEKSRVGKRIKRSKKKHLWKLSIDDHEHSVELYVSKLTNKRKVLVDGDIRISTKATSGTLFVFPFRLGSHQFAVSQQETAWDLLIDNVPFQLIYANQKPAGFDAGEWGGRGETGDLGKRGETGEWGGRGEREWDTQPQRDNPRESWSRPEKEEWGTTRKEEQWGYGLVTKQEESWSTKKKDDSWGKEQTWTSKKEEPWGGHRDEGRQDSPREDPRRQAEERWSPRGEPDWRRDARPRDDEGRFQQSSPRYSEPKPRQSPAQDRSRPYGDDYEAEVRRPARPQDRSRPYADEYEVESRKPARPQERSFEPAKPEPKPAASKAPSQPVDFFTAPSSGSSLPDDLFTYKPTKETAPQLQFPTAAPSAPPQPDFPSQPAWQPAAPQWGQPVNPMAAMMMNQYYTAMMSNMKPGPQRPF